MVIFWPDVHANILILPFKHIIASLTDVSYGTSWGLLDGEFYKTINTPREYLIKNLFYKLPEFILFAYIFFISLFFYDYKFFEKRFKSFKTKVLYILFIIVFPLIVAFITSIKLHDGLRYFLYLIPFFCIIPALVFYYLINHSQLFLYKLFSTFILFS